MLIGSFQFGSPNSSFVATDPEDPARFLRDSPVVDFPVGDGPSNPHQSLEFNGEIFVPDLGADKIWRIVNDGAPGKFKVQGQIDIAPGNGPRHVAVRGTWPFSDGLTPYLTLFYRQHPLRVAREDLRPYCPSNSYSP
jgi:hypothetical protein